MTDIIEFNTEKKMRKEPSRELSSLLEEAANTLIRFAELWSKIKLKGQKEGFTEKELQDMLKPYLRRLGKNEDQIYYLFHREEQIKKVKENRKFTEDDYKKHIEELSIKLRKQEEEIESLKPYKIKYEAAKKCKNMRTN